MWAMFVQYSSVQYQFKKIVSVTAFRLSYMITIFNLLATELAIKIE